MTTTEALTLALRHRQTGNLGQAEALCRQILDVEPQSVGALYLLGLVCQLQGRVHDCVSAYEQAVRITPDHADAHHNLGAAYASLKRFDEAAACCREVVRLRPDRAGGHTNLGNVLAALGRWEEAITCYHQALRLDPKCAMTAANLRMAQEMHGTGSPSPAAASSSAASAETLNDQGVAWMRQGRLDEAVACWQRSLRIKELSEVHTNLGWLSLAQGDMEPAAVSFRRALELKPENTDALRNLGILYARQNRLAEAVRCFQEAVVLRPDSAEVHAQLGNGLLAAGKPMEARDSLREALRLRPDHAETYRDLGLACAEIQHWREASDCWRRSLALNPKDPITYRQLGHALNTVGKPAGALRCYREVLALCPDDTEARLMVEALGGSSPRAQLPADYVASTFDASAGDFDQLLVGELDYRVPELLQAALGPPPESRSLAVLDLGCGTGLCGVAFREWARMLIGVDLSPGMLARARERGIYDQLILSDLVSAANDSEGKFDLVVAADVLIYLGDLEPALRAVYRALRPAGRFGFSVELLESGEYRLLPTQRFAHSRAYLERLAGKTGMREISVHQTVIRTENGAGVIGLVVVWQR